MKIINNCDELIEYMMNEFQEVNLCDPNIPMYIEFEGTISQLNDCTLDYISVIIRHKNCFFAIEESYNTYEYDDLFDVFCIPGDILDLNKNYSCITLPGYVRQELIATLKGE